jgi:hypothetical protein
LSVELEFVGRLYLLIEALSGEEHSRVVIAHAITVFRRRR